MQIFNSKYDYKIKNSMQIVWYYNGIQHLYSTGEIKHEQKKYN